MAAMRARQTEYQRLITPEEFMMLPEFNERYELSNGKVLAKPLPTYEHSELSWRLMFNYHTFDPARKLGVLRAEVRMRVKKTGEFLVPDVSFWIASRAPKMSDVNPLPPELVIEIQSPDQSLPQLTAKVPAYLDSGVRLVWIIQPNKQIAAVFRPGQAQPETIQPDGILDATDAGAIGFKIKLSDLFADQ